MFADNFFRLIAEDPFGSPVPAQDDSVQVFADNGVIRGRDYRRQTLLQFSGLLLPGYVKRDASCMNEPPVFAIYAGAYLHVTDRPVLAPQARLVPVQRFIALQASENIADDLLVDMEFRDTVADIFLTVVTEEP